MDGLSVLDMLIELAMIYRYCYTTAPHYFCCYTETLCLFHSSVCLLTLCVCMYSGVLVSRRSTVFVVVPVADTVLFVW